MAASRVTQILLIADLLGTHILLVVHDGWEQSPFPATDANVAAVLRAGLRIHEYVLLDGHIDYREIAESREHFEHTGKIPHDFHRASLHAA